jgi:hypothetical protein
LQQELLVVEGKLHPHGALFEWARSWVPDLLPHSSGDQWRMAEDLDKSKKFINFEFQAFELAFLQYQQMEERLAVKMAKFESFSLLPTLDVDVQNCFKKLYRWLMLWKWNGQLQTVKEGDFVRAIQHVTTHEHAHAAFKVYIDKFKESLVALSRALKNAEDKSSFASMAADMLAKQRVELHALGATLGKYRDFLLDNDPDPYVRQRGAFPEWTIGQEPVAALQLKEQIYAIESLDAKHVTFIDVLTGKRSLVSLEMLEGPIDALLHAMAHPLVSEAMMQVRADQLLAHIESLGELYTSDGRIVDFITHALARAMRADGRWQVMLAMPAFRRVYDMHMELLGLIDERSHQNRLHQLQLCLTQIESWVGEKNGLRDLRKIDSSITAIRQALQTFADELPDEGDGKLSVAELWTVRRRAAQQQLEYRYIFMRFYSFLHKYPSEELVIREEFAFVDHLLELIENRLIKV